MREERKEMGKRRTLDPRYKYRGQKSHSHFPTYRHSTAVRKHSAWAWATHRVETTLHLQIWRLGGSSELPNMNAGKKHPCGRHSDM